MDRGFQKVHQHLTNWKLSFPLLSITHLTQNWLNLRQLYGLQSQQGQEGQDWVNQGLAWRGCRIEWEEGAKEPELKV